MLTRRPFTMHMAVRDELARRERGDGELHAIHHGVEPPLQQLDQRLALIASQAHRLLVVSAELLSLMLP